MSELSGKREIRGLPRFQLNSASERKKSRRPWLSAWRMVSDSAILVEEYILTFDITSAVQLRRRD